MLCQPLLPRCVGQNNDANPALTRNQTQLQSALVTLAASLVAAVPSLEIEGNEFFNPKTGEKFQVVGIAYQPGGSAGFSETQPDPLSQPEACKRDAALMQVMGVNAIRVYNLNPNLNHDECASIFNAVSLTTLRLLRKALPVLRYEAAREASANMRLPRLACT